jgi:hypothetical protein
MSGGGGFIGDIVGGVGDIVGGVVGGAGKVVEKAVDYSGKLVDKTVGTVADLAKNIDIEDAAKTFILTGGNPYAAAFAATDYDEKLGFNPASFYNPTTGGFGFDTGNSFVAGDNPFDQVLNQSVGAFGDLAKTGIDKLSTFAQRSPEQATQYAQTGTKVLESMNAILTDVAAGKYSKSPVSEYNTRSVLAAYLGSPDSSNTSGLLSDYNNAKTKVNSIISNRSNVGKLAINESPFYNFLTTNKIGQSQSTQRDIFKPYLQQRGLI